MAHGRSSLRFLSLAPILLTFLTAATTRAADFYVSPTGTTSTAVGTGTITNPWSLATALSHPAAVHPGDTIWLRGGTYVGRYSSYVSGTASQPIVVRQYPGERARIDGGPGPLVATLTVLGQYTWYWGFEIFSSSTTRRSTQDGSWPTDLNRGCPIFTAQDTTHPGIKVINMLLHDGTDGISGWTNATDMEIYGNLIFNNGWNGATDRAHGNGLYVQNQTGTKKVFDNIIFNQYQSGMQIYGSAAYLDNIDVEGNTIFGNGSVSGYGCQRNFLFGGGQVATNGKVISNYIYLADSGGTCTVGGSNIGYDAGVNGFTIKDNWFANGDGGISSYFLGAITNLTMTGNHFLQPISGVVAPASYPSNTYHGTTKPTGTYVYVRPNAYEPGRANIIVFNWNHNPTVAVDVSGVLTVGASYEVRNAQNFFAPPVLSGVYAGGTLALPMTGLSVAAPIGGTAPPPTGPEFNVFIVLPLAAAPACTYALGASSASAPAAGGTGSVAVTAGPGCAWTASSGASWLTITGGASGTGNGTVSYSVAANASCVGRSGSLTVAGRTFTVSQAVGGSCVVTGSRFYTVTPCRVLDTRKASGPLGGPIMSAGAQRVVPITTSSCGVPAAAKSVAVNVTAVQPSADGSLHAYPGNLAPSAASVLSMRKNRSRAAIALLVLATDGSGGLGFQNESTGTVDVLVDVSGYFR
jgi:Putative binding domain, N-terminal